MAKEYMIATLNDLLAVPVDRLDDCLAEIKDGIVKARLCEAQYKAQGSPVGRLEITSVKWIDDGKRKVRNVHVTVQKDG